jgi:outer membrane protein OmpA-like peptidoglycan-associated protein
MRRTFLLTFFLGIGMILSAQNAEKKWAIGLGGGAYYGTELEGTGLITEFYLSRYLSPSFDLMLLNNLGLANSEVKNTLDFGSTFLNLRYKLSNGYIFSEDSKVQPYLYAGPGIVQDNDASGLNFDTGLGFKFPLSQSVALFLEAGYIHGVGDETAADEGTFSENFFKGLGGIEISFGKAKDEDNDGVPDRKDKCPNTPEGVAVDADGCPLDTDGDGVPDYKDDCPTEPGDVALNGCPDRDRDGIADKDDDCPDTPGLKEFRGCPDTDGDGVIDSKDECPDTPKGYKVDEKGCPIDTDGDGLVDEEDDCPTEAGPVENKGCPVIDSFNPILFDFDESKLKPAATKELDVLIKAMGERPDLSVNLYGHADEKGTEKYNMVLSGERANAARKYLTDNGVAPERIATVKWFGKTKPVASNATEEGRAKNRRVEIEVAK